MKVYILINNWKQGFSYILRYSSFAVALTYPHCCIEESLGTSSLTTPQTLSSWWPCSLWCHHVAVDFPLFWPLALLDKDDHFGRVIENSSVVHYVPDWLSYVLEDPIKPPVAASHAQCFKAVVHDVLKGSILEQRYNMRVRIFLSFKCGTKKQTKSEWNILIERNKEILWHIFSTLIHVYMYCTSIESHFKIKPSVPQSIW